MKFVSEVVGGDDVEQQDVFRLGVQPGEAKLHLGKHLPGKKEHGEIFIERGKERDEERTHAHTNQSLVRDQMCKSERCLDSGRFYLGPMIVEQTDWFYSVGFSVERTRRGHFSGIALWMY